MSFSTQHSRRGRRANRGFSILEVLLAAAALGLALGATAKLMVASSNRMAISRVDEQAARLERALVEQYQFCAYGLLPTDSIRRTGVLHQPWDQAAQAFRALAPYAVVITRSTTSAGAGQEFSTIEITLTYQVILNVGETPDVGSSSTTKTKQRHVEVIRRPGPQL